MSDGKSVRTMRRLHPTAKRRQVVIGFGVVEYGLHAGWPRSLADG
jgi:hypothetical protein